VVRGPDQPAVALTFHGSGDPALAEALLRQVEAAGARVTVLAVGTWLAANPDVGARILAAGHDLGNHTWHHLPMSHMGESEAYREISRGARIVAAAAGSTGWFRPSGTQHASAAVLAAAGRSGYRSSISYDVDPRDYTDPGADLVTRRVLAGVGPGSIVSLHLGHAGTVAAMPALLTGLRARSLRAVTLSALLVGVAR
jgi:peptidoglycan/xylan/chitin deacetylase (PgdA/CDA1 family)